MSHVANPDDKPSAEQIEADMAETREHLAASVDQLAAKLQVTNQAKEKAADVKAKAQEKVGEVRAQAQEKVVDAKVKAGQAGTQVSAASQNLLERFRAASRPVQVAVGAAPLALVILLVVRKARR